MHERKYFALIILGLISLLLLYAAWQLMTGIALAAILFVILRPLYVYLNDRHKNPTLWAAMMLLLGTIVILIPISTILIISLDQAVSLLQQFLADSSENEGMIAALLPPDAASVWEAVFQVVKENIEVVAGMAKSASLFIVNSVVYLTIQAFVMYLLLFYLFVEHDRISKGINAVLPFNPKNSQKLAKEFHTVIRTTMMGNGIVSIIMGVLLGAGLYLLGLGYVVFWTVLAIVIGFVPVLGLQIIWIPLAIIYLIAGNTVLAAEIFVFGFILSYLVDPFIRQKVQFRIGKMHGFVTLMGMIVGIMFFGPVGIVVGPMVLTFAYLLAKMIREEYVPDWRKQKKKR